MGTGGIKIGRGSDDQMMMRGVWPEVGERPSKGGSRGKSKVK